MADKPYQKRSRAELISALRHLEAQVENELELKALLHELEVHQEEVVEQETQLLDSQRELEASRNRYADLFDFAPIGYVMLDPHGVIQDANLTATRLLGVERGHLIGLPLLLRVEANDRKRFLDHMRRCRSSDSAVITDLVLRSRAGPLVPVELWSKASQDPRAAGSSYQTAIVDMTDRRRVEEERRRADEERQRMLAEDQALRAANAAKDRFLSVLSHELRTPLTPVLLAVSSLEARNAGGEALRPMLEMIRRNVQLEARLIDDLLDLTRIARGTLRLELGTVDLHATVRAVMELCADEVRRAGVNLVTDLAAPEHRVRGDPVRLQQVFWNLLKNAIRHTPKGRIFIRSWNPHPGTVRVAVRDTGAGIVPQLLDRVFRPFEPGDVRDGKPGLALGLAICKGVVEAHGGRISASSEGRDEGSTFEIDLATDAPREHGSKAAPEALWPSRGLTVLLVEDDADSAAALVEALKAHGLEVHVASSLAEARVRAGEPFDVLVSDVGLPDGTGLDFMRELRAARDVRGIALSGYGTEDDVQRSREAGFQQHLTKPTDLEVLLRAIGDVAREEPVRLKA